jgi:hypothetical protein
MGVKCYKVTKGVGSVTGGVLQGAKREAYLKSTSYEGFGIDSNVVVYMCYAVSGLKQ